MRQIDCEYGMIEANNTDEHITITYPNRCIDEVILAYTSTDQCFIIVTIQDNDLIVDLTKNIGFNQNVYWCVFGLKTISD